MADTRETALRDPVPPAVVGGDDWPAQAADAVERAVGTVRDKTTGPALTVARAVVYGLLAAILGSATLVLLSVGAVRLLDVYLPGEVWAAHLVVGAVFCLLGLVAWSRRTPRGRR